MDWLRRLEAADLPRQGVGERAALVAEERALDEGGRHRRAVHANHLPLTPGAEIVNRLGEDFLADACLAEQQHRGWRRRHLFDEGEHLGHRRAVGHDAPRRAIGRQHRPPQIVFRRAIAQLLQRAQRLLELGVARLAQQRLAEDPGDEPQLLDDGGRPLRVPARRAAQQAPPDAVGPAGGGKRHDGGRAKAVAPERLAIDGVGELVDTREPDRLAAFQSGSHQRNRRRGPGVARPGASPFGQWWVTANAASAASCRQRTRQSSSSASPISARLSDTVRSMASALVTAKRAARSATSR